MQSSIPAFDKLAISLSAICAFHCLVLPLLLVVLPSLSVLPLGGEAFHKWMVVAVLPISAFSLTLGCKQHKRKSALVAGFIGVALLVLAVLFGESHLGEVGEKGFTLAGAILVAIAHLKNQRMCKQAREAKADSSCACS